MLHGCCGETSVNLEGKKELPWENNALSEQEAKSSRAVGLRAPSPAPPAPPAWDPLQLPRLPQAGLARGTAAPHLAPSTATPLLSYQGGLSSLSHLFLGVFTGNMFAWRGGLILFRTELPPPFSQEACSWNHILLQIKQTAKIRLRK